MKNVDETISRWFRFGRSWSIYLLHYVKPENEQRADANSRLRAAINQKKLYDKDQEVNRRDTEPKLWIKQSPWNGQSTATGAFVI